MARFASALILLAAVASPVLGHYGNDNSNNGGKDCGSNSFFFKDKDCCLPHGGDKNPPAPPSGTSCPVNGWYWHNGYKACMPNQPVESQPAPSCKPGCSWRANDLKCIPDTPATTSKPPAATTKPPTVTSSTPPSKPSEPSSDSDCNDGEFFFKLKKCCLPHGGKPTPPTPPSDDTCPPSGWQWHPGKSCCVPNHPTTPSSPPPQCKPGCNWHSGDLKCYPQPPTTTSSTPPKPSGYNNNHGGYHKRVVAKSRSVALCPDKMSACPASAFAKSTDYECIDTTTDLKSCGGCTSTGAGQDCTAIANVFNVACDAGACKVFTCTDGLVPSADAKSCVKP